MVKATIFIGYPKQVETLIKTSVPNVTLSVAQSNSSEVIIGNRRNKQVVKVFGLKLTYGAMVIKIQDWYNLKDKHQAVLALETLVASRPDAIQLQRAVIGNRAWLFYIFTLPKYTIYAGVFPLLLDMPLDTIPISEILQPSYKLTGGKHDIKACY